jgi:hypothetical protein
MVGKASLFVVTGFSALFLTVVQNFGSITNRAVDNYIEYHQETIAHNIAVSGANIGANFKYNDSYYMGDFNISFQGGDIDLRIQSNSIMSIGSYKGTIDTVKIVLEKTMFSEYAYYSMWEKSSPTGGEIWWTNKDTVKGPFHTQDDLRCALHPVFKGPWTSHKGALKYKDSKSQDKPYIYGDYKPGYNLEIPLGSVDALEAPADSNGLFFSGHDTVYLNFKRDTLLFKYTYNGTDSALYLPDESTNGLIFAKEAVGNII